MPAETDKAVLKYKVATVPSTQLEDTITAQLALDRWRVFQLFSHGNNVVVVFELAQFV